MCFTAVLAGCAYVMQRFIVPEGIQAPLIGLFGFFAAAFFAIWIIRGDRLPLRASDVYWSRTWMGSFIIVAVLSGALAAFAHSRWDAKGVEFRFRNMNEGPVQIQTVARANLTRSSRYDIIGDRPKIQVRRSIYNQEPLAIFAALGLMLCAGIEAWHRKSLIARAAQIASNENAIHHETA
jgi:hypothetical protein